MGSRPIRFAKPSAPRYQLMLYAHSLDDAIPADDPVRVFAALLEDVDWTPWEQAYAGCGQPPIHPKYVAGAILYGLLRKVRSTRDLEQASRKHLDFLWLLEGFMPDHSTFADFQKRHADAIQGLNRHLAKRLVQQRNGALLQLIVDGTRLRADSARRGTRTAEFIEAILGELNRRLEGLAQAQASSDAVGQDRFEGMGPSEDPRAELARRDKEMAQLQQQRARYEQALAVARERDACAQEHNGQNAAAVRVPVSDPEAQVTPNKEGGYAPNYTPVAAVEPQTGALVFGNVLAGSDEAEAVLPAVAAVTALTGQTPDAVLADSNFAAGEVLEALEAAGIAAYMPTRSVSPPDNPAPRPDPSVPVAEADRNRLPKHGGTFARTAFLYDETTDSYACPMGHRLAPYKRGEDRRGSVCTYYRCAACPTCPLASDCIKGKGPYRTLTRDPYEPLREAAAQRLATPEGKAIYRLRAPHIEGLFGFIKRDLGIRGFRVRGLANVRIEWTWIGTAYNLKKLLLFAVRARDHPPAGFKNDPFKGSSGTLPKFASIRTLLCALILHPNIHRTPHPSAYLRATAA